MPAERYVPGSMSAPTRYVPSPSMVPAPSAGPPGAAGSSGGAGSAGASGGGAATSTVVSTVVVSVTVVGAQLTVVVVPAQIYAMTNSSAYVGLTGAFGLVPLVVFGLWGGALADHMDRRRLLMITTTGLIVTSALFWAQAAAGNRNVWLLLALFSVQQAFFAVNQPTRTAIIPRLLPPDQLASAASLNMTVMQFGAIVGPVLAGALIPVLGLQFLYLVDSVSLLATLWAVIRLAPQPPSESAVRPGLRSVLDGFVYLATQKILLASFVVDLVAMVFGMPRALFPQIAHESFGGPPEGGLAFAVLFAAIPAGAVLGGVLSGWVSRVQRQGLAVIVCIVVWGLAMAGFGVAVGLAATGAVTVWPWRCTVTSRRRRRTITPDTVSRRSGSGTSTWTRAGSRPSIPRR